MARRSAKKSAGGGGMHPAVVAILAVLMAVGGFGTYYFYSQFDSTRRTLEQRTQELENREKSWDRLYQTLTKSVPWFVNPGAGDQILQGEQLASNAADRAAAVKDKLKAYYVPGWQKGAPEQEQRRAEERLKTGGKWILDVVNDLESRVATLEMQSQQLTATRSNLDTELKAQSGRVDTQRSQFQNRTEQLTTDLSAKDRQIQNLEQQLRDETGRLTQERDRAQQELQERKEDWQDEQENFQIRLHNLREQIDNLLGKKTDVTQRWEETDPDGRVEETYLDRDIVFLNIGRQARVQRGLRFVVFDRAKGGVPDWKGIVEVIEVFPTFSKARIVTNEVDPVYDRKGNLVGKRKYDPRDPIQAGHFIANPLFHQDESPTFFLIGELARFTNEEAVRLIREDGGNVADELTVETDFLVAGAPPRENTQERIQYENMLERAQHLRVEVMQEGEFLKYLRNYRNEKGEELTRWLGGTGTE